MNSNRPPDLSPAPDLKFSVPAFKSSSPPPLGRSPVTGGSGGGAKVQSTRLGKGNMDLKSYVASDKGLGTDSKKIDSGGSAIESLKGGKPVSGDSGHNQRGIKAQCDRIEVVNKNPASFGASEDVFYTPRSKFVDQSTDVRTELLATGSNLINAMNPSVKQSPTCSGDVRSKVGKKTHRNVSHRRLSRRRSGLRRVTLMKVDSKNSGVEGFDASDEVKEFEEQYANCEDESYGSESSTQSIEGAVPTGNANQKFTNFDDD